MEHFLYDINRLRPPDTRDLNSKGQRKRKTGREWRELYEDDPVWSELVQMLAEYKSATKLMSTYVDGIAARINRRTGRVHPNFKPWGTVTGRVTIEDPPLQTIPRKTTDDKFDLEWPEDEPVVFVAADYNALETRMMWFLSQDPVMGADLLAGDFHRMTAARIFGIPPEQVTKAQRHDSKYVTFGIGYGRDVFSLALGQFKRKGRAHSENLKEATFFRERWKQTYKVFWDYREMRWEEAQRTGRTVTPFHRVRRYPLRFESGTKEWKDLRNQSYNFEYQSTASDLNLRAATLINKDLRGAKIGRPLFTVHDSTEAEVRASRLHEAIEMFERHMLALPPEMEAWPHPANFDLGVEIEVGRSWGDAVPYEPGMDIERLLAS
jgi:DNA polymerase-1